MAFGGKWLAARSVPLTALAKEDLRAALGGTHVVPGTTLSDVAQLTIALRAGTFYAIEAWFTSGQTVAPGILGVSFNFTGSLGGAGFIQSVQIGTSATGQVSGVNFSYSAIVETAARTASAANFPVYMTGMIGPSTAGNLTVRAQRSAGTHTVNYGWIAAKEI